MADCRDRAHLAALKAVRGGELLHERRFALGQARPLQIAVLDRARVTFSDAIDRFEVGRRAAA